MKYQVKLLASKKGKELEVAINSFLTELPESDKPVDIIFATNPPFYTALVVFRES